MTSIKFVCYSISSSKEVVAHSLEVVVHIVEAHSSVVVGVHSLVHSLEGVDPGVEVHVDCEVAVASLEMEGVLSTYLGCAASSVEGRRPLDPVVAC